MSDMPGIVTKTRMFASMDREWTRDPASHHLDYATMSFQDLLAKAPIPEPVRRHVMSHWVGGGWLGPDADKILQRGLYWAMRVALHERAGEKGEHARRCPLPICSVWICADGYAKKDSTGKPTPRFEVSVVESDYQVTLLFVTPPPPRTYAQGQELQPVWSTRRADPYVPEQDEQELERWPQNAPVTVTVRPRDSML